MKKPDLRSPLAIVRGLGSARDGTHHFIAQRVTAIALIPLTWWFISSLLGMATSNNSITLVWFTSGLNAALMIMLLVALFYHAKLGIQTIVEDYIQCPCLKIAVLLANKFIMFAFAVISILAVVKLNLHPLPQLILPRVF